MVRKLSFAIPNGGRRDLFEAITLRKQGVSPGVPDLFMAIPVDYYSGLFIEFKFGRNKPTVTQQAFIERLRDVGYRVEVCFSFEEAKSVVLDYLKGSEYD